ncbi:MAG: DUF3047 domain-containing protein [Candidatus Omnitrophica bacterium]|nr:DUF3047 domain-containing protein [Candidatus Omnitrophota bacterium]
MLNIKVKTVILLTFIITTLTESYSSALNIQKIFNFQEKDSIKDWQEKIFKDRVLYTIEAEHTEGYLLAESEQSCSGLFYKIKFDPKEFPMISWRWKVLKFPDKSQVAQEKSGWVEKDDYAARLYVIFPSIIFTNTKAIEYVWDEDLEEGSCMSSPYMENIKIIVAESGKENINQWVYEQRDIYSDYIKLFGRKPPLVGAIAVMTDADNTSSTAEAMYTDIKVGYKYE